MTYLINFLIIKILFIINIIRRFIFLNDKIFSCQKILTKNFPIGAKFSFIQVGANDGISFDYLYDFIINRKPVGIVIEPVKEYFEELEINYKNFPNIVKINKAVHPTENQVTIHKVSPAAINKYPDWVKGIASFDPNHHKKTGIASSDILTEQVEADNLMNIIKTKYPEQTIDYLQIDTEGFDYEVIKMLDFDYFKPNIIRYESANLRVDDQKALVKQMKTKGYFIIQEDCNTICVNLKKVKLSI